ncbi:MAG: hypothetical protein JO327_01130 [Nitrososphaeraceae archaeon]|nr:hypothetical protein [Nitrososphaeraceae archaeon]
MYCPYVLWLKKDSKAQAKNSYTESLNIEMFFNIISKGFMGGNIPRVIKIDVIREWLRGKSRDQIAKQEGIGAGTVSSIIKECRQNDSEFDNNAELASITNSNEH